MLWDKVPLAIFLVYVLQIGLLAKEGPLSSYPNEYEKYTANDWILIKSRFDLFLKDDYVNVVKKGNYVEINWLLARVAAIEWDKDKKKEVVSFLGDYSLSLFNWVVKHSKLNPEAWKPSPYEDPKDMHNRYHKEGLLVGSALEALFKLDVRSGLVAVKSAWPLTIQRPRPAIVDRFRFAMLAGLFANWNEDGAQSLFELIKTSENKFSFDEEKVLQRIEIRLLIRRDANEEEGWLKLWERYQPKSMDEALAIDNMGLWNDISRAMVERWERPDIKVPLAMARKSEKLPQKYKFYCCVCFLVPQILEAKDVAGIEALIVELDEFQNTIPSKHGKVFTHAVKVFGERVAKAKQTQKASKEPSSGTTSSKVEKKSGSSGERLLDYSNLPVSKLIDYLHGSENYAEKCNAARELGDRAFAGKMKFADNKEQLRFVEAIVKCRKEPETSELRVLIDRFTKPTPGAVGGTIIRPEERGVSFLGFSVSELIGYLQNSKDNIEKRKAARVLGDRAIAGKLELTDDDKRNIEAVISAYFEQYGGVVETEPETQLELLWPIVKSVVLSRIKSGQIRNAGVFNCAVLMRDRSMIEAIISEVEKQSDLEIKTRFIKMLKFMKEPPAPIMPCRHNFALSDEESQKLYKELIIPFIESAEAAQ